MTHRPPIYAQKKVGGPPAFLGVQINTKLCGALGFIALGIAACGSVEDTMTEESELEEWILSEMPEVSIGAVEGEGAFLLTDANHAALLSDGRIAIADAGSAEVRVFTSHGELSWVAGGRGDGPGEFQFLSWIRELPSGEIAAYDLAGFRVSIFDAGGALVDTKSVDLSGGGLGLVRGMFNNGAFLLVNVERRAWPRETIPSFGVFREPIYHVLLSPESRDTLHVYEGNERYIFADGQSVGAGSLPLGATELFAISDSFAVTGASTDSILTVLSENGETHSIPLPLPRRLYTSEWQGAYSEHLMNDANDDELERAELLIREAPAPSFIPLADQIQIDDQGRIWTRLYAFGESQRDWLVIDHTGEPLARISIPESIEIMAIHKRRLLGRTRDEFDVERIHLWHFIANS